MNTSLLSQACTILQASTPDDTYNAEPGTPTEFDTVCYLEQAQSREAGEGAVQESEWRVFLPPSVTLTGSDALLVDGETYELVGDPWPVWNPRLRILDHIEARARRTQ